MDTRCLTDCDHPSEFVRHRSNFAGEKSGFALAFSGAVLIALLITGATAICAFLALRLL